MGKQNEPICHWLARTWTWSGKPPTPLNSAYCNTLPLPRWSVRQKLSYVSSVQFSYVAEYAP